MFLALYLALVFPAMPAVGDAADYAASIRHGDFGIRTIHIGYNLIVFPFVFVGGWFGQSTTAILNTLAVFCMAGAIAILHRFYISIGCERSISALACIVFGTSGIIWYHAEFGEVQALLILLIVTCLYWFVTGRSIVAGILFGFTLLVSQAAAPTVVCFPLIAFWRRSWEAIIKFGLSSSLSFVLGVAPVAQDYFWGPRGVIPSMEYYPSGSLLITAAYFIYRLIESHTVWTVFLVIGMIVSYRQLPHIFVGVVALWGTHAWLNLRLSHVEYGFAWMPFFILSSLVIAMGATWAYDRHLVQRKWTEVSLPLCVILGAALSCVLYVMPKRLDAISLQGIVRDVRAVIGNETLLATPHIGFVYVYETDHSAVDVWQSSWKPLPEDAASWDALMSDGRQVFLLLYKPQTHVFRRLIVDGPIGVLLLSEAKRDRYREEGAVVSKEEIRESLPNYLSLSKIASWTKADLFEIVTQ